MILNFKIEIKLNYKDSYNIFLNELNLNCLRCPSCKAKGKLKKHAYYKRHVVNLLKDKLTQNILTILRVKCYSCGRTHALLPDFIIPYHSYGYNLILKCLKKKFNHYKIREICKKYNVSFQLLYSWIRRFQKHQGLGSLAIGKGPLVSVMLMNLIMKDLSSFLIRFFNEHQYMFMQIRRSP